MLVNAQRSMQATEEGEERGNSLWDIHSGAEELGQIIKQISHFTFSSMRARTGRHDRPDNPLLREVRVEKGMCILYFFSFHISFLTARDVPPRWILIGSEIDLVHTAGPALYRRTVEGRENRGEHQQDVVWLLWLAPHQQGRRSPYSGPLFCFRFQISMFHRSWFQEGCCGCESS